MTIALSRCSSIFVASVDFYLDAPRFEEPSDGSQGGGRPSTRLKAHGAPTRLEADGKLERRQFVVGDMNADADAVTDGDRSELLPLRPHDAMDGERPAVERELEASPCAGPSKSTRQ